MAGSVIAGLNCIWEARDAYVELAEPGTATSFAGPQESMS
jgi:hypothetical protein